MEKITNRNYNKDQANLLDKEMMYDFAKEMYFDGKSPGNNSVRDSLMRLLKSPSFIFSPSGASTSHKKIFHEKTFFII